MIISNFSGGITSAVATKLALQQYPDLKILYIETGSHHPDMVRFLNECEIYFAKPIERLQSRYKDHFDVIERTRFINGPSGASCTKMLKIRVRQGYEYDKFIEGYIWGFDYSPSDIKRFERIKANIPEYNHYAPLIDKEITKNEAAGIFSNSGVVLPEMYKLGYPNNNCIGCVKGGKAYWLMIQQDFPEHFDKMVKLEESIGHSCINGCFLKDLKPLKRKVKLKVVVPECGVACNQILEGF